MITNQCTLEPLVPVGAWFCRTGTSGDDPRLSSIEPVLSPRPGQELIVPARLVILCSPLGRIIYSDHCNKGCSILSLYKCHLNMFLLIMEFLRRFTREKIVFTMKYLYCPCAIYCNFTFTASVYTKIIQHISVLILFNRIIY